MATAMEYTVNHPLELESDYPYKGKKIIFKGCKYDESKGVSHNTGHKMVTQDSASALTAAAN